jgi:hypothetical protein
MPIKFDLNDFLWGLFKMAGYNANQLAVAKESWDFWKSVGCDDLHAAAWLGNEDGETSFVTSGPFSVGDKGQAHGPAQMHKPRMDYIKENMPEHVDILTASHLDCLKAIHWEATPSTGNKSMYRKVWAVFMATTSIDSDHTVTPPVIGASEVLIHNYEQSGSQARDIARRTNLAHFWLGKFGGTK